MFTGASFFLSIANILKLKYLMIPDFLFVCLYFCPGDVPGLRVKTTKPATNKPCGPRRSSIPEHEMKIIEGLLHFFNLPHVLLTCHRSLDLEL